MKKENSAYSILARSLVVWVVFIFTSLVVSGQAKEKVKWTKMSANRTATFYDVQQDFNKVWRGKLKEMAREKSKGKQEEKEEGGLEVYKRWESYMAPRVYPSGNMSLPSSTYEKFMNWKQNNTAAKTSSAQSTGNWTSLGPIGSPSGPSPYSGTGAGRVNFIRFDPTNSNTMYVGAPDGGLWKSTNGGTSWTTNTDFLSIIGCSDVAIDPTNTQIMYLATGDLEGNKNSIGVFKSTNGGASWATTGANWPSSKYWTISKILMNPSDPLNMLISTNVGVFRTTDGWVTSDYRGGSDFKDIEFKPGDPATVYAAGNTFWKSIDNGITFFQVTAGLPTTNVQRIALGVTPGNTGYVYALIGKQSDQSFLGVYRSTNSGTSFSLRSSSPNLLGYETDGLDAGGQAFYDLSIAVSATNAELITTGGVNHWQSADGGTTWTNKSYWAGGQIHADIHDINYLPGSSTTLFSCNDGGIFKSTDNGTNWSDISNNLSIAQIEGIGLSANVESAIINGEQDNGTNYRAVSSWTSIAGGDGGDCFIDYNNNNIIYNQYIYGSYSRSDDRGVTNNSITNGLPSGFDFYSKWHQDPVAPSTIYTGGLFTLYRSTNKGNNWSARGTPPGVNSVVDFAIAPTNNSIIYAIKYDAVSRSTDAGLTFTDITGTLPVANASLTDIIVSATNSNKIWVTFSGYAAGKKVYKSIDGGGTWTNLSAGLPNLPVNVVVSDKGNTNDAIYIGADVGVYYRDNTQTSFTPFMTSLPNVTVRDLEIYYPTGKLRAGTFGRGVWESHLNGITYEFTGSGNWSTASNWKDGLIPPPTLLDGTEVIINPTGTGTPECIVDVTAQTISSGAKVTVNHGKKITIVNKFNLQTGGKFDLL